MAFGFGFNKQKVLSSAEKFVQQGKLQNAIAEYEKILKNDPKDLTVNNTVGDLYARLGDTSRAIECFKSVGDAYASQGFTVKAIAMYKKITKLHPSVDGSLKLAELYTQQGLFNDARAQYLQVAEDFLKNSELDQAVRLFQKVLEMDPENVQMRVKLAEVYIRLGKKNEAWELFSAAAESLRSRGSLPAAEDILQRMLSLDPGNSYVLLLRGRAALDNGDSKKAAQYLEKTSDLDSHPDGLRDLLKAYLQTGRVGDAAPIAEKLLNVHNDPEALFLLADGYSQAGQFHESLDVYSQHADRLLATDSTKLLANLHSMIGHVRDDCGALDQLLQLLSKAGESTHVGEVTELLAHASVQSGNLVRARDLYQMLATMEPQNAVHMQNYQQVQARIEETATSNMISAEEGAVIVDELEATAPVIDQPYPESQAAAIRSAITDADLYLSYNLPDKAIVPLLGALPQAPRDVRLNQRLAALHTRAGRFTEAAVCCRNLESVYSESGHPEEAARYGELAGRYEERAAALPGAAPKIEPEVATAWPSAPPAIETAAVDVAPAPAVPGEETAAAAHPEFAVESAEMPVHEIPAHETPSHETKDLSAEWDHSFSDDSVSAEPVPATPELPIEAPAPVEASHAGGSEEEIAETVEETRFYLEHYMADQARTAFEKLRMLTQEASILDPLRAQIEAAGNTAAGAEPEAVAVSEDSVEVDETPAEFEIEVEAAPAPPPVAQHLPPAAKKVERVERQKEVEEPEEEVAAAPPPVRHEPRPAAKEPVPSRNEPEPEPAYAASAAADTGDLAALVADLESSLGDSFPQAEPAASKLSPAWPAAPAKPASAPALAQKVPAPAAAPKKTLPPKPKPQPEPAVARTDHGMPAHSAIPPVGATSASAAAAPALSYSPAPVRPLGAGAQAMLPQESVDLSQMFGELKQELEEEAVAGDDDPETHYNLGVAFREMGLLDEAIAELQKVCSAVERGHAFPQLVQTYTWLAQCFLDKGVPEAAVRWYEKALAIPNLDGEARLAINYELGSACETANDKSAALHHFTQVYGANIDYRDVAERIQALKS